MARRNTRRGSATSSGGAGSASWRKEPVFFIGSAPANVPAGTAGNRVAGNTNYPSYVAKRAGQLTGIACITSMNPTGSTAIVRVSVNGATDTTLSLNVPVGTQRSFQITGLGVSYVAGDVIRAVLVTDASWTQTSMTTTVDLELTESA
jgi:hypothetical protein